MKTAGCELSHMSYLTGSCPNLARERMARRRSQCVVEVRAASVVLELLNTRTVPSQLNFYLTLVRNQGSWSTLKAVQPGKSEEGTSVKVHYLMMSYEHADVDHFRVFVGLLVVRCKYVWRVAICGHVLRRDSRYGDRWGREYHASAEQESCDYRSKHDCTTQPTH